MIKWKYSALRFPGTGDFSWLRALGKRHTATALFKERRVKLFLIFLLVVSVIAEGYYIYLLQDKIEKRNDELKNISVQLAIFKAGERRSESKPFFCPKNRRHRQWKYP